MKRIVFFLVAFMLFGMIGKAQVNLQNGLVAYYPFNGNANDESGNGNNGIVNGATLTVDRFGKSNSAFSFNGAANYISVQNNSLLCPQNFTLSLWFYSTSSIPFGTLLNKQYGSTVGQSYDIYFQFGTLMFTVDGSVNELSHIGTIAQDTWYNVLCVFDPNSNSSKLYVNGLFVAQGVASTVQYDTHPLIIGAESDNNSVYNFFGGSIDDIRIYNRPLNEAEIQALYSEGNSGIATQNQSTNVGKTIDVDVNTSELTTSDNVISYQFDYNYDNTKLEYVGNTLSGTLAEGGSLQVNPTNGKLSIAWARQTPLLGTGAIVKLQFKVLTNETSTPTITNVFYNNDAVSNIINGTITVTYQYGNIDANGYVRAFDAALVLQYSVGLDPIPDIDPIPWEDWRINVADVNGDNAITALDASEILQYTVGLITDFSAEGKKRGETADVNVAIENNEIVFRSVGALFGLNIYAHESATLLGQPTILHQGMLSATNINSTYYAIALAATSAPAQNTALLKIPIQNTGKITFSIIANTTTKTVILDLTSGISEIVEDSYTIFPNPTHNELVINGLRPNSKLSIYDLTGKLVMSKQTNVNVEKFDVSGLCNGIYTLKIETEKGTVTKKFVRE